MHSIFNKIPVIKTIQTSKVKLKPGAIKQHAIDMPVASRSSVPQLGLQCVAGQVTSRPAEVYNLNLHRSSYLEAGSRQQSCVRQIQSFRSEFTTRHFS